VRDNPATRLRLFLESFTARSDISARTAALRYFELDETGNTDLMIALARVAELPTKIAQELSSHPEYDPEVDLDWRPAVDQVVDVFFALSQHTSGQVAGLFDRSTLLGLRHAASKIAKHGSQPPEDDLVVLREMIDQLLGALLEEGPASDAPDMDLQNLLMRITLEMRRSVMLLQSSGVDGMQAAYEQLLGAMYSLGRQGRLDDVPTPIRERLNEVALKYESILSIASSGFSIAAGTAALFGIGS